MKTVFITLLVLIGVASSQTVKQFRTITFFRAGHTWADSIKSHGDSIGVYKKGVIDSVKLDMLKTTTSADDIISNHFVVRGGNNDISIQFNAKNVSGTMKGTFEIGFWNGLAYSWQTASDTVRSDTTFVLNFIGQEWAKNVSGEFPIRWKETGNQQNKIAFILRQFRK